MEHRESTQTPPLVVRPAAPEEFGRLLPVCVEAFADEAVSAWVEPQPGLRLDRTRELFETSLREAVDAGQLVVAFLPAGDAVAASVWIDLTEGAAEPPPPADDTTPHQTTQTTRATRRLATVLAATSARHPATPHVYLSAMAALPRRRGLGAGSAMLRHGLDRARRIGLPVYLEASTPRNRRLYLRHGFRDRGEPIHLPDGGPSLQPMWHPAGR
ncbi:GNAT family N-acetyltransferase [Promicromonospora sp. MS192]|uniref:GNAT family N-acetyltransferase n=1 Tax=Promicromonospora sp. MS192 TaxID=3412684 RepID=UPI003C2AF48D